MYRTVFKIKYDNNSNESYGTYNAKCYEDVLAIVSGFLIFITEGNALYSGFFEEMAKLVSDFNFDDEEKLELRKFISVLKHYSKGRLDEELVYMDLFPDYLNS